MSDQGFRLAACHHCGQHIEFPVEGTGSLVTCPNCQEETILEEILPVAEVAEEPKTDEISAGELKDAMTGAIPRRRISVFYQLGLLLVAVFMLLLPVAYLAFVCGLAWGTYWYARHAQALFAGPAMGFYGIIIRVILYVAPIIAGVISVFFMLKPILARPRRQAEPEELNPARHPRLYQFIAHLSDGLRVPIPRRIFLDCELNASVGFRRGILSFLGNDLVMNIGLPLVTGLNTRQLAATIAHELGHCTQGFAMRLEYIVNRIDGWFVRVIYARDTWDDALDEWADSIEDSRVAIIVWIAQLAVWLSRRVLSLLLHLGHAATCFLSRQMEFHADACAIEVAGSEGLESLLIRLREQNVLLGTAFGGLNQFWKTRHLLPSNLPEFIDQLERRLPPEFRDEARNTLLNETAGWFDTHPTPAQRIRKARQRGVPGIFSMEKPARWLFHDFAGTAQVITLRYYRQDLRLPVTPQMLKPADEFFPDPESGKSEPPPPKVYKLGKRE
jgi:Zn-dependent protease with chaperone function